MSFLLQFVKPKIWFVGADFYDDVQNTLSENLRHCHQSQFWWGISATISILYTPLIVQKHFCKIKKQNKTNRKDYDQNNYSNNWWIIFSCQIREQIFQVQSFLLHFWQGMPEHMMAILDSQTTVLLVGVCDTMLYKAIANVLMPSVLQALPDRWMTSDQFYILQWLAVDLFLQIVKMFCNSFSGWE